MIGKTTSEIRLLFAGDVAPVQADALVWAESQPQALLVGIQSEIETSDAFIVNLECPLTQNQQKIPKVGPNLKSSAIVAKIIAQNGVTAVSLANNHILDYKQQGIHDTISALEANHIQFFGVGPTAKQACEPFFLDLKGNRICLLAYAEHEFNWQGDDTWTTGLINPADNVLQIQQLRHQCDRLVIFTHCGPEYCKYPSPRMVRLFHAMIDAGADAIINSHGHTVMGIELYKERPICYGLGNFWFPYEGQKSDWNIGLMARLRLGPSSVMVEPIAIEYIPKIGIVPVTNPDFAGLLKELSSHFNDESFIKNKWLEFCMTRKKSLLRFICKSIIAMLPSICYRKLFKRGNTTLDGYHLKGANLLRALVVCETHHEVIATIFDQMCKKAGRYVH